MERIKKIFTIIDWNDDAMIACCNIIVMLYETVHESSTSEPTLEPRNSLVIFEPFIACADKELV